jgi:L-iditol 2-dehydrogenase
MKAAFLRAPFEVEIRQLPDPEPGVGELLLRPKLVGICGNDIQYARNLAKDWERFGHEPVAEVLEVGADVDGLAPGDLVACQCSSACGFCAPCLLGRTRDCENRHLTRFLGFFADTVVVDRRNVWKLQGVAPEAAVLLEPMGMAFDVVRLAEVELGRTLALVGPGPIGLMAIKLAKLRGAHQIFVIGISADSSRCDLCFELGADQFINADERDPVEAIMDLTAGRGVDAVINTATVQTIPTSIAMCAFGGKIVFMGESTAEGEEARPVPGKPGPGAVSIDVNWLHLNRLELRGSFAVPNGLLPLGHALLAKGVFPTEKLVTHIFPFNDLAQALHFVAQRQDGVVKAAIRVT